MTSHFLRWFFLGDNPVRLYGFWPALVWLVPLVVCICIYFPVFETLGLKGYRGMIPLTYVLRCIPPVAWIVFFVWFVPHLLKHRPH